MNMYILAMRVDVLEFKWGERDKQENREGVKAKWAIFENVLEWVEKNLNIYETK